MPPHVIQQRFRAAFHQMPPLAFPGKPPAELARREYDWWRQLVATVFSGERFADFEAFFGALFDYFADAAAWTLFPDTQPALTALKTRGLRLGVVSNFDGRLISICKGLGLTEHFDVIVMSSRAGYAKPDPRIFRLALASLDVDPADALHVGDSMQEDVAGATAAGLRAWLLNRDRAPSSEAQSVSDLHELVERV